ncbi:MAG: hypothetical protein COA49_06475 [Bacteroidetes bacterium]|nr:MAG: hypothetical protein COA49_06475 [Bacteroidota bacterium]
MDGKYHIWKISKYLNLRLMFKCLRKFFFANKVVSSKQVFNDLGDLFTDVHSHLVPGVDDGAHDMETAVALIQRLQDLGYKRLVITPHIMSDLYPNTPEILKPKFEELKREVARKLPPIELLLGAEYFLEQNFIDLLSEASNADNVLLTFPCKDPVTGEKMEMILFEFAFHEAPNEGLLAEAIFKMQTSGLTPVLAHCARYPYWNMDRDKLKELHSKGVILSINAATLSGAYGDLAKETALFAIENGWVRMICSDTHAPHHISAVKELERSPILADLMSSGVLLNSGVGDF